MDIDVLNSKGAAAGRVSAADAVFGVAYNEALVHQVVTAYLAAGRSGSKAQKTRGEVSGSNKKPWRQKGTGRARAGSTRGPLWRGGGVTFAAVPRDHSQKVNRKMYRGAMRSIVSELLRQNRLRVVEGLSLEAPKTRALLGLLSGLGLEHVLLVTEGHDRNLELAARNLPGVAVTDAAGVEPVGLVGFDTVLITQGALKLLEARLA